MGGWGGEPGAGGGADPGAGSLLGYGLSGAVGSSPGGRGGSVMRNTVGPQLNAVEDDMRSASENRQSAPDPRGALLIIADAAQAT